MRLIVARCEVVYTGRLATTLPAATRLVMLKSDGSVLIHADAGGYKPLNCIWNEFRPGRGAAGLVDQRARVVVE